LRRGEPTSTKRHPYHIFERTSGDNPDVRDSILAFEHGPSMSPSYINPTATHMQHLFPIPGSKTRKSSHGRSYKGNTIGPSPLRFETLPDLDHPEGPVSTEADIPSSGSKLRPAALSPNLSDVDPSASRSMTRQNYRAYHGLGLGYPSHPQRRSSHITHFSSISPRLPSIPEHIPVPTDEGSKKLEQKGPASPLASILRELVEETRYWDESLFVDTNFKTLIQASSCNPSSAHSFDGLPPTSLLDAYSTQPPNCVGLDLGLLYLESLRNHPKKGSLVEHTWSDLHPTSSCVSFRPLSICPLLTSPS
jgi:hypothetical protein